MKDKSVIVFPAMDELTLFQCVALHALILDPNRHQLDTDVIAGDAANFAQSMVEVRRKKRKQKHDGHN